MIELQHINVKLLVSDAEKVDLEPVIPVFHSWIQGQVFEELLLDVADYRHVQDGPGIILIGHQADYSVDNIDGRLGIRYNRKAVLNGGNQERLAQAARAAIAASLRLEEDSRLNRKLLFNGKDVEITMNDRLVSPNNAATRQALEPELHQFAAKLFAGNDYSLSFQDDPRRLFGAYVKASRTFSAEDLLQNLAA